MFTAIPMQAIESFRDLLRSWSSLQTGSIALLSVTCLAMAGVIYAEIRAPLTLASPNSAPTAPTRARDQADTAARKFALPPLQSFSAVTERPLFSQTRRPSPQGGDDSLGAWSSFTLTGIIISANSREALIMHGRPPTLVHLQEGQDVEGWMVTSILPDRVVLRGGGSEHELKLLDKPPAANPSTPNPSRRFNP